MLETFVDLRPKVLGKMKQKKRAAREHLRAVLNVLSQLDSDLAVPQNVLRPIDCPHEERCFHGDIPFLWHKGSGAAKWDAPNQFEKTEHLRVVLGADEGSPLFSAVMFLHSKSVSVRLVRDELRMCCICMFRLTHVDGAVCMLSSCSSHRLDQSAPCII